jgi:hypothetical protein
MSMNNKGIKDLYIRHAKVGSSSAVINTVSHASRFTPDASRLTPHDLQLTTHNSQLSN